MTKSLRDPISAMTHLVALIVYIPFLVALIAISALHHYPVLVTGFSIFAVSVIGLYLASSVYHMVTTSPKIIGILRKIDHCMIFVLIAGTYTPICLGPLRGPLGYALAAGIWTFGAAGIILKIFYFNAPRAISTAIYVIMGWLAIFAFYPLINAVSLNGLLLLAAGGIMYTVGAVIYGLKKPNLPFKNWGFHEIFHLFVIAGTAFHILFMFLYVL